MARILAGSQPSIFKIRRWPGINENPDGDTKLKIGEATEMRNFKITRDGNLQIRPGTKTILELGAPVRGLWHGRVNDREVTVCAAGGKLWSISPDMGTKTEIGHLTDDETTFFGFSKKLYIMNGHEYIVWDGDGDAHAVEGYRPLVAVSCPPEGGGTALESVNRLCGMRRARFSPNGTAATFKLPEANIHSADYVRDLATGNDLAYSYSPGDGTITLEAVPERGVNSIEVGWTMAECARSSIEAMRFSELYSGAVDARIFLYGDGSNMAVYSGLDYNGQPTAEYFPDLNVLHAGEANTPITGMIRHFTMLLIFKSESAYIASYSTMTLEDGTVTAAFYVKPINRDIGNSAMGQVRLITNSPFTLHGSSVYEWRSGGAQFSMDERNAERISGRVGRSLSAFDLSRCITFDDEENREYYICCGDTALILNYDEDAWYIYTSFPARCFASIGGKLYIGTDSGQIRHVSRMYRNDDLQAIDAFWRSGSIAFERDWQRKYSPVLYLSVKPESGARVSVTARSNRRSDYPEFIVSSSLAAMTHADFSRWSFSTNRQPQVRRLKLKVKKAAYYQLIFQSCSASATATILTCDLAVRYTGNAK